MPYILPPDALDRELVLDFFWKFAVFECALKREGFLKRGRQDAAEPDWDRFGAELGGQLSQASVPQVARAMERLIHLSPHRQIVRNGVLDWKPVERRPQDSVDAHVLRLLRVVRNNLFHGGKYPDGAIEEIARNRDILQAATTILDACYAVHPGVRRRIDDAA